MRQQFVLVAALRGQAELGVDVLDQLHRVGAGMEQVGDLDARFQLLQETAAQGGLAGARLTDDLDDAPVLLQGEHELGQHFLVTRTQVKEFRIGGQLERFLGEAEKLQIVRRLLALFNHPFHVADGARRSGGFGRGGGRRFGSQVQARVISFALFGIG